MQVQDSFSAKIMLFGEYSILLGSPALSVPFTYFSAALHIPSAKEYHATRKCEESNRMLREFYNQSLSKPGLFPDLLNLDHLRGELDSGLYLESTIPSKYGVGSSGALCAALYYRYAYEPIVTKDTVELKELVKLRQIFISMESFFHGKSSGLDPLVIYLRRPLIINEDGLASLAHIPGDFMQDKVKIFLLDTGRAIGTGSLVRLFLEHYSPQGDKRNAGKKLSELNNSCISRLFENDLTGFRENLQMLSEFQFHNLSEMIPDHMRDIWSAGLDNGLFSVKLCGSGGGGFLTGFTPDYEKTLDYFKGQNIPVIPVSLFSL
jgi:mevalonate kinase